MSFITRLRNLVYEQKLSELDVDEISLMDIHRNVLENKPLLHSAFGTFYDDMTRCCDEFLTSSGFELELGSGVGFFKDIRKNLITSDIRKAPHIDRVIDAQSMEIPDNSVRCIYAINVFHHLPQPEKFLSELCRVLKPAGGCILIEPHIGFGSSLLHRYLHKDEHFDPMAASWETSEIRGPLSGANQALSHIVFERDRKRFEENFGENLEIVHQSYPLNSLRYFFSGGLNFKQLLPSRSENVLTFLEKKAGSYARHWAFHQLTVLKKVDS